MSQPGIKSILGGIEKIADDLTTNEEQRLRIALREVESRLELESPPAGRGESGPTGARRTVFSAGWRPFIGWVGGAALAYQFLLYPLLTWTWSFLVSTGTLPPDAQHPELLDVEALWVIVTGMLGVAGMRSFDKMKGTQTDDVRLAK